MLRPSFHSGDKDSSGIGEEGGRKGGQVGQEWSREKAKALGTDFRPVIGEVGKEEGNKLITKEYEGTIWDGGYIQYLPVMEVIQLYLLVNIHRTDHTKMLNFTVCKLNLNIFVLQKKNNPLKTRPPCFSKFSNIYIVVIINFLFF